MDILMKEDNQKTNKPDERFRGDPLTYAVYMNEVKWRIYFIDSIIWQRKSRFDTIEIENTALHFRMIFEVISLSTIAAHRDFFDDHRQEILKDWNIVRIIKTVKRINPRYFPIPIRMERTEHADYDVVRLIPLNTRSLSEPELIEFHGKCGNFLHAKNRYKEEIKYDGWIVVFREWRQKIVDLLNIHQVQLYDDNHLIVIIMNDKETGKVKWLYNEEVDQQK